ncbi:CHAT domain-containing tetratricopeptide repeat protein [uncultured Polaribacter sp.]|uniref:CHAT domain-containing tetratricopeptide repeat protein n=1 Tax=uncultured Polaribacter sp. TaxID=174711 RepID=UPI0030D7801D|tara:strand:- start:5949 stop:12596 length:6648 start_codon:yes stop_codon:yes gene_type:complete
MKKILLAFCFLTAIQCYAQNDFYNNSKYIDAKEAFVKADYKKFQKIVKKQLSKDHYPTIFIDLANKIIIDIDPKFENEIPTLQQEIASFSRKINDLHQQERYYEIYVAYKKCDFLEKLSPYTFYQLISSLEEISYDDYKKLIDLNLKVNGDHFRAAWSIGYLSNSLNIGQKLWHEIATNSNYKNYPGVQNYAIHLKNYHPNIGLTNWESYVKLYGVRAFIKTNRNDAIAYRKLGHLLKTLHRYEEAKTAFLKSNEIDPFYSEGSSMKDAIICMYLLEQESEATKFTEEFVKTQFPNANKERKLLEISSELFASAGNKTKARENVASILEIDPQNEAAIIQLSEIESTAGRNKEVLKLFRKLSKNTITTNLSLYNRYLNVLTELEMYDEFIEEWQNFIENDITGNETIYNKFYTYFSSVNEKETALEMIDKGIRLYPLSAWSLRNRTQVKIDLKEYTAAEIDLRKSYEIDPNSTWSIGKFKTIIALNKKDQQKEIQKLYNQYPFSYTLLNALKDFEEKENQSSFLENFKGENIELLKTRNLYYIASPKELFKNFEEKLAIAKTPLDSLFISDLLFSEKYFFLLKNKMTTDELTNMLTLSDIYKKLGGNMNKYHKYRAYVFRALSDTDKVKQEATNAIKVDPNNYKYIRETITYLGNKNAFISLRKSVEKDFYEYNNIQRYVWINNLYGGSNINAIWAHEKCKENFPDSDCSKGNYVKALDALGDPYKNMESYKSSTNLGTTNRYINWYNATRTKTFDAKKQLIYDKKENKLTTIDENGEISIMKDDPYSGKPVLKQKGSVWIQYGYTKNGDIAEITTSSNKNIKLIYNENNKIIQLESSNDGILDFKYNELGKPINIILNKKDTLLVSYDKNTNEIDKVSSNSGHKMSLKITQIFQKLLSLTKSFNLDDISIKDEKYTLLKDEYDNAAFEINYGDSENNLTSEMIKSYQNYVIYLKENLSNNSEYATEALDVSSELLLFLNSDIATNLKLEILNFSDYFYEILKDIRRQGTANMYWNTWNTILENLENEKQLQSSLNAYRKKIESLQSKFKSAPIQLLSSAEWLPKSSLSNNAYWTSSNLEEVYTEYDFANTPANHIIKRENGDILIAFNKGIAVKRNGFWRFLYYDTLNKKLIQDPEFINIKSKTTFNYFSETNEHLFVNTSSGTFLIEENYSKLLKIKLTDDSYIGNNSCKIFSKDGYLFLYSNNAINVIAQKNNEFEFIKNISFADKKLLKVKFYNQESNTIELIAQTDQGFETIKINTQTKEATTYNFIDFKNTSDFEFTYSDDYEDTYLYFLQNNTLYKKKITNEEDRIQITTKPIEILGNIILNKKVLGLCLVPVNQDEITLGIITDIGINFYRDNHFEFFKIDSKNGLDEFTNHYFSNNSTEFGILTKQKMLQFSLDDYFYSFHSPKKIKVLKEPKITLMQNSGSLYYSNNEEILNTSIETDGWGTSVSDFDVAANNDVYLADYKTVNKLIFDKKNQTGKPHYSVEKLFTIDPFQPEDFYIDNSEIKQIKIAKDGTIWLTTALSVFRYNPKLTPALKEFNFFKNDKEFPAKSLEVFNLIETFDGKIMVVNSSENWNNYKGIELDGGLIVYNKLKDKFEFLEDNKNIPNFPWFITSYTNIGKDEAILGTTSGFAYHSTGGIKSYRQIDNKSYVDIEKKYKNLFLGTEGVQFGDFLLFGCAEGVIAFKDNQWFYPERLNQLLPDFSKHGKWGGNKVNSIAVDHLQRLNISTDLGLLIINATKIDPYDLLLMNRDVNKTIEYFNVDKLQKERENLISNLPDNSESKKVVEEVSNLKDEIYDLEKSKTSFAKDFKLKETGFKTINIDSIDTQINRITKKHSELLLTLKEKNPVIYQTLKIPPLGIAGIRSKLKDDECIVQYIPLTNKLIIQMVTKNKLILKEVVVGKEELFNLSLIASDLLSSKKLVRGTIVKSAKKTNIDVDLDAILAQLYNNLLSPIQADLLPFKNKVQIIAEGALNYVPFDALITKDGKDKIHYAVENYKFIYLSSLYMLQLLHDFPELQNNNYLLMGDPDSSLPFARKEVEEIAEKFASNTTLLVGNKAKVNAFRKDSKNKGIIHLATHGFVDKKTIKDSWLLFSDSKLKLSEVYELNLEETALMVLSACETGLGKDGIETTTLARAFANAGVQNLIASLWRVNDESTKILMNRFYDDLKAGASYLDALHDAQIHLMNYNDGQFKSPKYWAPFILIGKP